MSKDYSSSIPLLVTISVFMTVMTCHGAKITLSYDPSFDAMIPYLDFGPNTATAELDLIRSSNTDLEGVDFHLSPFITPAPLVASRNYTVKPVAFVSMCLASTFSNSTGLTLEEIGAALAGTPSSATASIQWFVASPLIATSSASLLQALVMNSVAPFTSITAWPSAVLSNPNVKIFPDGPSVSAALNSCPSSTWCIGPQLPFASWAASKPCLRIRYTDSVTGDITSYSNRLTTATAPYLVADPLDGTAYSQGRVYPFVGGVYLATRLGLPCDVMDALTDMLVTFFTNASNTAALNALGMQGLTTTDSYTTLNLVQPLSGTNCSSNVLTAPVKGDANLVDAVAHLNFDAFANHGLGLMVSLTTGSTDDVLADVYSTQTPSHAAFVEGLPNQTLRATKSSIVAAPIFAHGLTVVYSLDGRDGLVVSPCTLLGMFNGTIQYWDDPALTKDNLGILLPHVKITRVMATDGSKEAIVRGVTYVAQRCGAALGSVRGFVDLDLVSVDAAHVVPTVQVTPGSIGLALTSRAAAASMQQLAILFPSKLQLSGSKDDIFFVIGQSSVNSTTNEVQFPDHTVDYFPFVSVVYAVVDTDAQGACGPFTRTLQWLKYAVGETAETVLINDDHVVLRDAMRTIIADAISQVKCDGVVLFPVPVDPVLWWPYAVVGGAVTVIVVAMAIRTGHHYLLIRLRPSDATQAIAVMFVGIKNHGAVIEAGDENAAAVFRCVADTVRQMVRRHGCYEARRIDEATVMIVAKSAKCAVACAEDIVLALSVDVLWLEEVMLHPLPDHQKPKHGRHLHTPQKRASARSRSDHETRTTTLEVNTVSDASTATVLSHRSKSDHGASKTQSTGSTRLTLNQCVPEIYAGVHWTHVMMDVSDEMVSYHGAGITAAAGIADLAVGGQIIVSRDLMDRLSSELGDDDENAPCYSFAALGDGHSSLGHAVQLALTSARFPEWLIARAALRRKSLEEKGNHDGGNMIAAAMAKADGTLGKRRIAVVSMLVQDLVDEGAHGRAAVIAETFAELLDIVTANRGQIHSITDCVVTVTVGAGTPVAMAAVRAAQIAMHASDLCVAIGLHTGSALVGTAMGGRPVAVGRVIAGATLMRLAAARAGLRVCASDSAQTDLAAKFELATVDLIAVPWDLTKYFRCLCVAEERVQSEEGEWLYDMNDGFEALEQRLNSHLLADDANRGLTCSPITLPRSAVLERNEVVCTASNELYHALLASRFVKELAASRLSSLSSFAAFGGSRATVL